jgi:hypothetical protein
MKRSLLLTAILFTACASQPAPTSPTSVSRTGEREQAMASCPSAVAGARTELTMIDDGVELRVTAEDPEARREIELRADKHLRMDAPAGQAPEHTGLHGGPGAIGHCPILHDATTIAVRRLPDGVAIRVRAMTPGAVAQLQDETKLRVDGLSARR